MKKENNDFKPSETLEKILKQLESVLVFEKKDIAHKLEVKKETKH